MEYAFIIEPASYYPFENEAAQIEKCKEWGLLSEKASKSKVFYYKGSGMNLPCTLIGFVDKATAVVEFENRQKHCIHPAYLKEMQAANYGQKPAAAPEDADKPEETEPAVPTRREAMASEAVAKEPAAEAPSAAAAGAEQTEQAAQTAGQEAALSAPKEKAKKEKAKKVELPEEKVKMTATVKEFTTVPNHFSDNDDEVVVYEAVKIEEPEADVGAAWSSYSATLKKLELEVGDTISFEAKIIAKKLTKHPVPYKINNPAKIQKTTS